MVETDRRELFPPHRKPAIQEAVGAFAPSNVTRLAKLKKGDIASEVERLADGTGWMLAVFQNDHHTEPEDVPEVADEADAPEDAANVEEAHALAA